MIRKAVHEDIPVLTSIYNGIVAEGGFTGHLQSVSIEQRTKWFNSYTGKYAIFVKEIDGKIIGYVTLSPYREGRAAFDEVSEISYFIEQEYRGKGLGKSFLEFGIDYAKQSGFRLLVAILFGQNTVSYGLLEKFGFTESGRIPDAGKINGTYLDHVFMSRKLIAA